MYICIVYVLLYMYLAHKGFLLTNVVSTVCTCSFELRLLKISISLSLLGRSYRDGLVISHRYS